MRNSFASWNGQDKTESGREQPGPDCSLPPSPGYMQFGRCFCCCQTTYYVGSHYEVLAPAVILPPAPPAPADLTACYESMGGPNVCNDLAWSGSSGVTYNVYRNSSSPVPIDAGHRIASGVTETEYTACGRYKNYYYAVTAVNAEGESEPSNEAQASTPVLRGAVRFRHGDDPTGAQCHSPDRDMAAIASQ